MKIFKRITALLVILSVLCAFLPAYAAIDAQTRHTNIAGWTIVSSFSDSEGYVDSSQAVTGSQSLKLVNRTVKANDNTYLRADTTVNVNAGVTYRLEFYAKSEKSVGVQLLFDWTGFYSLTPVSETYDWTKFKFLYTAADDATLNIRFLASSTTNGFWVDDIKFYDVAVGETGNLLANGDFEGATATASGDAAIPENMIVDIFPETKTIDGNLDDWKNDKAHKLERVEPLMDDLGAMISADIRYSFDNENLYLGIEVTDGTHVTSDEATYWNGDSFQWATGYLGDQYVKARGLTYYPDENRIHQQTDDFTSAVTRNGDKTIYEIALPWSADFADNVAGVPDTIRFNAIVNNNDGKGRAYALEINEGITIAKDINKYLYLRMWNPVADIAYRSTCVSTIDVGDSSTAVVYLSNPDEEKKSVKIEAVNFNKTITLNSGEESEVAIPINLTSVGVNNFDIMLTSDEESVTLEYDVMVYHNHATYLESRSRMQAYVAEIKELLYQCADKGISTDYETAYYSIMARQIELMDFEASYEVYDRVHEYEKSFTAAYPQIVADLKAYLAGEKTPFAVPKYTTGSEVEIDGTTIYADMEVNGTTENRPMFFIGYGNMYGTGHLTPFFSNLGVNMIATDIHWDNVVKSTNSEGWMIDIKGNTTGTAEVVLEDAKTNNYAFKLNDDAASNTNNRFLRLRQSMTVEPGETYVYGLRAKGDASRIWMNADGFMGKWNSQWFTNSSDWKDYKFEYTIPEGDTSIDFGIVMAYNTKDVYIDDVYLMKKGTTENLVVNGDLQAAARELTDVEKRMQEKGWYIDRTSVNWLEDVLARAEENNIIVSFCLSPHFLPAFILDSDEGARAAGEHFMPWAPFNETVQEAIKLWYEYMASILNKYDCVYDVVAVNEPKIFANNINYRDYYGPMWPEYLKNKYGTIDKLNATYGDDVTYTDFSEVPMYTHSETPPRPEYYDYINFNDSLLEKFIDFAVSTFKSYAPDIKVSAKVMPHLHKQYHNYYKQGTNYENLAKHMDLNCMDSYSNYNWPERFMSYKMAWYDYVTSVEDTPIWDLECHTIEDGYTLTYTNLKPYYSSAEVWNGAVHKRTGSVLWWWDATLDQMPAPIDNEQNVNASFAFRPMAAMKNSKAMMDIQRLSYEITALQDDEPEVGLLYSRLNVPYNHKYTGQVCDAYNEIIFNGQKVNFIYDSAPERLNNSNLKLLVVAGATHAKKELLQNIKTFMDNGGKVLLVGDNCLKYDEYNNSVTSSSLYRSVMYHKNIDKKSTVSGKIKSMNLSDVVLVDAKTGESLDMIEWCYTEYNGKILVNIMDYTMDETATQVRNVKVLYKGKEITKFRELRDDIEINGTLEIRPYQPILVQFEK